MNPAGEFEKLQAGAREFIHAPHPHVAARKLTGPAKVADGTPQHSAYARFNSRVGMKVTLAVGTMTCAWAFTGIALVSLPSALGSRNLIVIVSWLAQTLIQLVLLSIILFGQGLQAAASDKRAEATYHDASATLHEASEIQRHLQAQDDHLHDQDVAFSGQEQALAGLLTQVRQILDHLALPNGGTP